METAYKKVTSHGSISIPIAMRRALGIEPKDAMAVEEENGCIRIRPYRPRCIFCGDAEGDVRLYKGKGICSACRRAACREGEKA